MTKNKIHNEISRNFSDHNHKKCFEISMNAFKKHCHENNFKLTPLRLKVFELLLKDHRPIGAYQILEMLGKEGFSSCLLYTSPSPRDRISSRMPSSA